MLISESLAKRRFPDQDPIGKRVQVGGGSSATLFTIVGVVGDVRQMSLAMSDSDAVYAPTTQWHWADERCRDRSRTRHVAALTPPSECDLVGGQGSTDRRVATMDSRSLHQLAREGSC